MTADLSGQRPENIDIGHNNAPEVLKLAPDVIADISGKMADIPVVESEDDARLIKMEIDRAKACIKDLEAERDGKVRPLNDKVADINGRYRKSRRLLGDLLDEMLARVEVFIEAEKRRRQAIAIAAALKAREAERLAKEAERLERERLDDAAKGEVGVDVAEVIVEADEAFEAYQRAERAAKLAEKQTHVKVGGGFGRAIGMKKKEILHVSNAEGAVAFMGCTPDIEEAILKSARAYRTVHGKLPTGVYATVEEHL